MGKKGGKKGTMEKIVEDAEPNLPTIPEETEKNDTIEPTEAPEETATELIVSSDANLDQGKSIKQSEEAETAAEEVTVEENLETKAQPSQAVIEEQIVDDDVQIQVETEKPKKKKDKKGKKGKGEVVDTDETGEEEKPKKAKKGKEKPDGDQQSVTKEVKKKKGKKGKPAESGDGTENAHADEEDRPPEGTTRKSVTISEDDDNKEAKKKKKKGKKEKPAKKEKETHEEGEGTAEMPSKSTTSVAEQEKSTAPIGKKKKSKKDRIEAKQQASIVQGVPRPSGESESSDQLDTNKPRSSGPRASKKSDRVSRGSIYDDDETRRKLSSRISAQSSEISFDEQYEGVSPESKTPKGKKGKKQKKGKKDIEVVAVEETEEEIEQRKAAKAAEKLAKKEAKKQAKREAAERRKAEKAAKPDADPVKKRYDELRKIIAQTAASFPAELLTEAEQGPKKKASKKERAKMTAEMAEKAKAEMEMQIKKMEEWIKKKKEEDRLAAIEKDKKDTLEQGWRIEQLQETAVIIEDIVKINAEIVKEEKDLTEWEKYVACGKLPNPAMCADMNTYLHIWELELEETSVEKASERTADALQLLSDLDELIEMAAEDPEEGGSKLENWKWIRQLFRNYQSDSLDVATYRLLRDVEHNLNRINIPTADYNFKDDFVTLCLWLRVMLPIPLPNPRRPPKPRIDVSFNLMNVSILFPATVDSENAAIRAMYLNYDHLSDLSETYHMPEVPEDYYLDLLAATKKEWRTKLKYKYDHRDKSVKSSTYIASKTEVVGDAIEPEVKETSQLAVEALDHEERKIKFEQDDFDPDEEIPIVPFQQLEPTASEYAISLEDSLYEDTREKLGRPIPENVINLRKFVILGGVFHVNLLAQPPQPQDFVTMDMTITCLCLPKKLEVLPFKVVYTPYVPPEPEPSDSSTSIRKLPEEIEEEIKRQEEELDKLIFFNVKWPSHVIFLELPVVCRWDEENRQWSNEEIHDVKHNEDKCMISFRTGVFGIYGLATYRYSNLPFQAYDIKPETDESVTIQLTAAILMMEFNIKDGLIAITQLQNSPNMTLQDTIGKYMKLYKLKRMMKEAGIDIFPSFDAFCYVNGSCEKQWAMEKHLYFNMAQIYNCFNFSWSRWNLTAGRRKIVLQIREYVTDRGKQRNHQMLLVTPLKATFIACTEVSQTFSENEVEQLKFCADLYHLMKISSGIFVRNKVTKACKSNVYTLAQFLTSIRLLSFS